jgi:hypothetical protein
VKTMRISFRKPDRRAGQMVELDEAGAQREIANGTAEEVSDQEWDDYQRQMAAAERAPAPAPAPRKSKRSR